MSNGLITPELAKAYQAKAVIARTRNRLAKLEAAKLPPPIATQPPTPPPQPQPHLAAPSITAYQTERLARVRAQLTMVDSAIETELGKDGGPNAQTLDRLAAASARLEEQERRLSDRSLPATRRGDAVKPSRGAQLLDD